MQASRRFVVLAMVASLSWIGWGQVETPPDPGTGPVALLIHPEHPAPLEFVTLEVVGQTNQLGDLVQLRSVTLVDRLIVIQLHLRWSPSMAPLARPWNYRVDLGRLDAGLYRVLVFANGLPAVQRDFRVGGEPTPQPLLVYNESGGFIGLNNHLLVMPNGDYLVHWLILSSSGPSSVDAGIAVPDCAGRLNNEQMGRLERIFTHYDFEHWDPVYGPIPGATDPNVDRPIIADGRVWRIEWKGKVVHVFEGLPLPEKVTGLIHDLSAFAMALARECVPPPPPPGPRLHYQKSGGFAGVHYQLKVNWDGGFYIHWPASTANSAGTTNWQIVDCTGRLTNTEAAALEEIFARYGYVQWDASYGHDVPDGFKWEILWQGKAATVFQEGLPDRVAGLVRDMDAFAARLAARCITPPLPPLGGEIRSIRPEHPSATDVLTIVVGGHFPDPGYRVAGKEVVVVDRQVRVKIHVVRDATGPVITVIAPWEEMVHAGPLPEGGWLVVLEINGRAVAQRGIWVGPPPIVHDVIVRVFPEIPNASSPVALEILGTFREPRTITGHSWAQENHTIHVHITSATAPLNTIAGDPATGVVIPWRVREELGLLAAGEYHVVVHLDDRVVAERNFVVQSASNLNPADLSGMERGGAVDVDSSGRVDYEDLLRLMRYWHVE